MATTKDQTWNWFVARYSGLGYPSLSQFASDKGYQKSSLSRYFHRQRVMPTDTLVALSKDLQISPIRLLAVLGLI